MINPVNGSQRFYSTEKTCLALEVDERNLHSKLHLTFPQSFPRIKNRGKPLMPQGSLKS